MATLNDSIIIGSVLVLVFGALFYYLYSRLLYSEKRVNVMENILLDLKTASETFFTSSSSSSDSEENYPTETVYHTTTTIGEIDSNETVASLAEELTPETTTTTTITTTETSTNNVSINYESMNLKELQAEARTRNISGVSAMRRKEIIENLRRIDNESSLPITTTDVSTPIEIEA